jgi:hypothetical protein
MFCAPGLIFGGTEGVGSRFHVLHARTHFRWCRGRWFPFSCFALSDSFSAVPTASLSRFHVLHSRTRFRRCGGRRLQFPCFALPDSFSTVPWASAPVFMFCSRPHFRRYRRRLVPFSCFALSDSFSARYRGRWVPFSCFACPNSFSAVPTASYPVFMFCAPGHVFSGVEGVGSNFHVLRARTLFRRYRRRRVPFSCFALPDTFLAVPRASGPVFMFSALELVFGGTEDVWSRFQVLRALTHFLRYRRRLVPISSFALPDSGVEGVRSSFHVLRSRTHFRRFRGCRVQFSCLARPNSFSAVPTA